MATTDFLCAKCGKRDFIYVWFSPDGPIYFKSAKKAIDYARQHVKIIISRAEYERKLQFEGSCDISEDTNIIRVQFN